jgi:lipopolysaccharide transport system permease protein
VTHGTIAHVATTRRLQPSQGWTPPNLAELWRYKELLSFLIWRDVKVRYKQTALGVGWALAQPLLAMVVFTVFFGRLAGMPSDGIPYPIFSMAALVPWTYFATAVSNGSQAVVVNQQLVTKVYFPRLIVPLAAVLSPLVDFVVAFSILIVMMFAYGLVPGAAILWLPVLMAFTVCTAAAISIWLSALNVRYRDVRYVVPFLVQIWMFATPIAYPASLISERWRPFYGLNPLAGVIEGFRWALLGGPRPGALMIVSVAVVAVALAGSLLYFRRVEGTFADVI